MDDPTRSAVPESLLVISLSHMFQCGDCVWLSSADHSLKVPFKSSQEHVGIRMSAVEPMPPHNSYCPWASHLNSISFCPFSKFGVFFFFSVAVISTMTRAAWAGSGHFTYTFRSQFIAERSQARNSRRAWSRDHRGILPIGLLSLTTQAHLPRGESPLWAGPPYIHHSSRKCSTDLPTASLMEAAPQLRSLFPGNTVRHCPLLKRLVEGPWAVDYSW